MTLDQFLQSEVLVADWRKKLESDDTLREVLQMMEESAPTHNPLDPQISDTFAQIRLGYEKGYAFYGRKLRLIAQGEQAMRKPLQTSYEPSQE